MSITIHYRGRLRSPKDIPPLIEELEDICKSAGWEYRIFENTDPAKQNPFVGITFKAHQNCENIWMTFSPDGTLVFPLSIGVDEIEEPGWAFTKTQFAGVEVHIAVCTLLKYIAERWFEEFEVTDEGGYYHSLSKENLEQKIGMINEAITALAEGFEGLPLQQGEGLQDRIEKIINALRKKKS